jgi:hypothetical protein
MRPIVPILDFAYKLGFNALYPWQKRCLLRFESGRQTALQACNYSGKTSTIFVITALWVLYNFPRARILYISATFPQVRNQYFQSVKRLSDHPMFSSWEWLETEIRHPDGGIIFGRSTGEGGRIEGIHDEPGSPACLLVDEAKTIADDVMDALSRCTTTFRLFASSTGRAYGEFYRICTEDHRWETFRVTSADCAHISPALIADDKLHLRNSVYRVKHSCEWLDDDGSSIISLESLRALQAAQRQAASGAMTPVPQAPKYPPGLNPEGIPYADIAHYNRTHVDRIDPNRNGNQVRPMYAGFVSGPAKQHGSPSADLWAFCDFSAGGSNESALGLCDESSNTAWVEAAERLPDSMAVVGWFLNHFRRLGLKSYQIAGDEGGVGKVIMDRMAEQGFRLSRVNNGSKAKDTEHYANVAGEQWSIVAELIEQQLIAIRNCDEILVKQLCSRQKFYDSAGRVKLEPKSEMKEDSPDRADALIGAICFSPVGSDAYATRPVAKKKEGRPDCPQQRTLYRNRADEPVSVALRYGVHRLLTVVVRRDGRPLLDGLCGVLMPRLVPTLLP